MTIFSGSTRRRTRVKICGITTPEQALAAANAGADAIGLVFYAPSPRAVTIEQAREVVQVLPPFVSSVALFVNPEETLVESVEQLVRPDLLQFHGNESDGFAAQFGTPYIKALRVKPDDEENLVARVSAYESARGILLDTWEQGVAGGTGKTFDWSLIPDQIRARIVLAGGLNPENVVAAITQIRPYAVDVSGGVESTPGCKDADKMARFVQQVNAA